MIPGASLRRIGRDSNGQPIPGSERTPEGILGGGPAGLECQDELIALFETLVHVMFCIKTVDGVYTAVNGAFVRRTGHSSKRDVIGRTAREVFDRDLADRYEAQDREVIKSGEPLRDELELIRRPDGELGWYLTTKLPVTDRGDPTRVTGLVSVSRDLHTPTSDGIALESLQHVVLHVRTHLAETIRVGDLAAIADCTVDQLDRRIRKVFGLSTKQYMLRVRVERAAELLTDTDVPLAEVAATVGFYDQPEFTRRFARMTNMTPAQFRQAAAKTAR